MTLAAEPAGAVPVPTPTPTLTLQVRLSAEALPDWLGKALAGLDPTRVRVRVLLQRPGEPAVVAAPVIVLHLAQPADCEAGPLHWVLLDGQGRALCAAWPLLDTITRSQGIALQCRQLDVAGGWPLRRALHVAAAPAYARGRIGLPAAIRDLLAQALADLQCQAPLPGAELRPSQAAPKLSALSRLYARARGRWRATWQRQGARWLSESWQVGLIDQPVASLLEAGPLPPVRWLTDNRREGYWADPYGLPGSSDELICEFYDRRSGLGRIEQLRIGPGAALLERSRVVLPGRGHASFPQVFELEGRRLALAETMAQRSCWLYEVDDRGAWRALWPLLQDTAAIDPALLRWEGRYWLAYTDGDLGEHDNLCLQYAERLEGPWLAHANNPVKRDIRGARMAGSFFQQGGALYRPSQDCLSGYGAAVALQRVVRLSPTQFEEITVRRLQADPRGGLPDGLHTVNAWGNRTLVDGKRLTFELQALLHKLGLRRDASARARRRLQAAGSVQRGIFVYVPHLRTGGGEVSMLQLAEGFAAAGREVTLVVHTLRTQELPVPPGVQVISLERGGTAAALLPLVRALRLHRPQVLLSAFPHTNIATVVALALARSGTAGVLSEHAPLIQQIGQQASWRYRLLPPLVRRIYPRAAAVVAVSQGVRTDLKHIAGPALAPRVIANPVLPPGFEAEAACTPDHPWLCDPQLQVVLSVCRLAVEKDLPTLVKAFADLQRSRPNVRLLMAGEGPERDWLEALVADLGLQAVVQLPGRTQQALRWMHHATVFVLPSRFEGFGNVLIEALACGTPVVATDCPVGPRELLDGGRYGALVPVGDATALARAIEAVLDDPRLPEGAHAAALGYTRDAACAAYLRLFDNLPSGAGTGAGAGAAEDAAC